MRALTILFSLLAVHRARATDYMWTGAGEGSNPRLWATADNWEPPGVPGEDDRASISVSDNAYGIEGVVTVKSLTLNGGVLYGQYTVDGQPGDPGVFNWYDGIIGGQITVGSMAGAEIGQPGSQLELNLDGGHLVNLGVVTWLGGVLRGSDEGVIENRGTFISATGTEFGYRGGLNTATFDNQGLFIKTIGTEDTVFGNYWTLHNSGRIQVMVGRVRLDQSSNGIHIFSTGSIVEGNLIVGALDETTPVQLSIEAMVTLGTGTIFEISKTAVVTGTGGFMGSGDIVWSGGGFTTPSMISLAQGTTMHIRGPDEKFIDGESTLINMGEVHWTDTGSIGAAGESRIVNHGLWSIETDAWFGYSPNGGSNGSYFENRGTLKKSMSNGVTRMPYWVFQNRSTGVVDVESGVINAETGYSGVPNLLEDGSRIMGAGKLRISNPGGNSRLLAEGTVTIDAGGTLELGPGSELVGTCTFNGAGTALWTGSVILGDQMSEEHGPTIAEGTHLLMSGPEVRTIDGATLFNHGSGRWIDDGTIRISGGTFDNGGTLTIEGNGVADYNATGYLKNEGTIEKINEGTTKIYDALTTSGTVRVERGTLAFAHGGYSRYTQTAGLTVLADGGTISAYEDNEEHPRDLLDIQGGSVEGDGVLDATVMSKAIFRPGMKDQAGRISILGDLMQDASGKVEIELGGVAPGTEYDQLNVGGMAMLAGPMEVALIDGFMPAKMQRFEVVGYASHDAEFNLTLPANAGLVAQYETAHLVLNGTADQPAMMMQPEASDGGCGCSETNRSASSDGVLLALLVVALAFGARGSTLFSSRWGRSRHSEK